MKYERERERERERKREREREVGKKKRTEVRDKYRQMVLTCEITLLINCE